MRQRIIFSLAGQDLKDQADRMSAGKFITLEGGEGAGKSTQIQLLAEFLGEQGIATIQTREPGGTETAEQIRDLLLSPDIDGWDPLSETLLHFAARREHFSGLIKPALDRGDWVLCDRFADSTMAYQGYAGGVEKSAIDQLYTLVVGDRQPDLTLILDIPAEAGLARAENRGTADRYEKMDIAFHETLRAGFLEIAQNNPERCAVIDGTNNIEDVAEEIRNAVSKKFYIIRGRHEPAAS